MVGLMGCGKTSVGRRLSAKLDLPFVDADEEIEAAAGKTISEIFADHGEAHFRDGERKVIARLLKNGPQVLATGGGAFMHPETRENIKRAGISIWLKAELPVLMRRVMRRDNRPLLKTADPEARMRERMIARYPIYAEADLAHSRDVPHEVIVEEIIESGSGPLAAARKRSHPAAIARIARDGHVSRDENVRRWDRGASHLRARGAAMVHVGPGLQPRS